MTKPTFTRHPDNPRLDPDGHEIPDGKPLTLPSGFRRPETLAEQVQRLVRTHVSMEAARTGRESFEESEDFDVGDDEAPSTPYEEQFDPVLGRAITPDEFRRFESIYRERMLKNQAQDFAKSDLAEAVRRPKDPNPKPAEPAKSSTPS